MTAQRTLRIGHSPDPDDAFMWYGLADVDGKGPKVDTGPYRFEHVLEDIETLNRRAERGELEITALSVHQYAYVARHYALTSCGSSMGEGYGPVLVARRALTDEDLAQATVAVPGERTTAFLALSMWLGKGAFSYQVVDFDRIIEQVSAGRFDAGLIIHEGQLTYAQASLERVMDLGQWWAVKTGLPLPLGANAIRRDLADQAPVICRILLESIRYALEHRQEAIDYAMHYARDLSVEKADRFIDMYVNDYTLDYGPVGRQAVQTLLTEAAKMELVPPVDQVDFVEPA